MSQATAKADIWRMCTNHDKAKFNHGTVFTEVLALEITFFRVSRTRNQKEDWEYGILL